MAVLMTGCLAANHTGVRLGEDRLPVVVNCGTWISRVDVTDADNGRRVWAAHAARTAEGGIDDVGSVVLGSVPGRRWVEDHPLALEPRPVRWRFSVGALDDVIIVVSDTEFEPGRIHRPGNTSASVRRFREQTCSEIPISLRSLRITAAGTAVIAVGAALFLRRRRRGLTHAEGSILLGRRPQRSLRRFGGDERSRSPDGGSIRPWSPRPPTWSSSPRP